MLNIKNLNAFYGQIPVLYDINLSIAKGQIVGIIGANAAGKSTIMYSLAGLRTRCTGDIQLNGESIINLEANKRVEKGLVLVPERRRLFPFMSVLENLEIGAYTHKARAEKDKTLQEVFELLPRLYERRTQLAGSMSGGEQQMLAIGRAMMGKPTVLLLDEPTEGLAPIFVDLVYDIINSLREMSYTVVIVEQHVEKVLNTVDMAHVVEYGKIIMSDEGKALLNHPKLKEAYLGM